MAYTPENNPYIPGDPYSYDLKWVVNEIDKWKTSENAVEAAAASAQAAGLSAEDAAASAEAAADSAQAAAGSESAAKNYADNIADPVSGLVTNWLAENITQPTTPAIDASLTISGAAADAKATGDAINDGAQLFNGAILSIYGLGDYDNVTNNFIDSRKYAYCLTVDTKDNPLYIKSLTKIRCYIRAMDGTILANLAGEHLIELPYSGESNVRLIISDASKSWGTTYTQSEIDALAEGLRFCLGSVNNIISPHSMAKTTNDGSAFSDWTLGQWASYKIELNMWDCIKIFIPSASASTPVLYTVESGVFTPIYSSNITSGYITYCAPKKQTIFAQIRVYLSGNHLDPPVFYTEDKYKEDLNLYGINMCALGDSYIANNGVNVNQTWASKIAAKYNMNYTNLGINGGGICVTRGGIQPMTARYTQIPDNTDLIILEGGENDANESYNLTDFETEFEGLIKDIEAAYPTAKLMIMCPWGDAYSNRTRFKPYADIMRTLANKYGVPFYDSWIKYVYNATSAARGIYYQSSTDHAHLNNNGHNVLMPMIESFIKSIF